jgi:hypothetical protein
MDYPDYWLCQRCSKPFSEHIQIGAPNEDDAGRSPATYNWCISWAKLTVEELNEDREENSWSFKPIDNLSLIESLANKRGITDPKQNG